MSNADQALLTNLVLEIYDTIADAGRWPDVLDKIAAFVGARGAFVFEIEGTGAQRQLTAPYFSSIYDQQLVEGYLHQHRAQELLDQDKFAHWSKPTDEIQLIGDAVLADSEEELMARPNVQQMLQYGIRYRAGALLNKDHVNRDRFALQFSRSAGPVSQEKLAKASPLMPHIAKALDISRPTTQLAQRYRSIADTLDLLVVGICILDARGNIVVTNREFRRQMETYPLFRKDPAGKLRLASDRDHGSLVRLQDDIANHGLFGGRPRKEAILLDTDDANHALCVEVAPLSSADAFGEAKLRGHIIYSMDTRSFYQIDGRMLADTFSLTDAEVAILQLMAEGLTNAQISERRSKSVETINSQVKSILEKTRSANRTQVIRLATNITSSFVLERLPPNG